MSYVDMLQQYLSENDTKCFSEVIKGTCYSMCPIEEIEMRQKEKLVHILEVEGSKREFVKCYSRSAADSVMTVPCLLRPFPTLVKTIEYLLFDITKRTDVSNNVVYEFVNDRLRAVRQDMIIQRLPPEECVVLLEPMIRFYVYYGYKLIKCNINTFDPVLNRKYLLESIKWYLSCNETMQSKVNTKDIANLTTLLSKMSMDQENRKIVNDRVLIEGIYILTNLGETDPMLRYLTLPNYLKKNPKLKLIYEISVANLIGNYSKIFNLMKHLCPLTYLALSLYLPMIQRRALQVLCTAYSSKQLSVPVDMIQRWLGFQSTVQTIQVCMHYGLNADRDVVKFMKGDFRKHVPTHQPYLPEDDFSLDYILTYTSS